MKKITWIFGVLAIPAIVLGIWLSTTDALAVVWVHHFPASHMSSTAKGKAAQAFRCMFPEVPLANIDKFKCEWVTVDTVRSLNCQGAGIVTLTDDNYILGLADGSAGNYISRGSGTVDVLKTTTNLVSSPECVVRWNDFIGAAWGTQYFENLLQWFCARNPADESIIDCEADKIESGTATQFLNSGGGREGGVKVQAIIQ